MLKSAHAVSVLHDHHLGDLVVTGSDVLLTGYGTETLQDGTALVLFAKKIPKVTTKTVAPARFIPRDGTVDTAEDHLQPFSSVRIAVIDVVRELPGYAKAFERQLNDVGMGHADPRCHTTTVDHAVVKAWAAPFGETLFGPKANRNADQTCLAVPRAGDNPCPRLVSVPTTDGTADKSQAGAPLPPAFGPWPGGTADSPDWVAAWFWLSAPWLDDKTGTSGECTAGRRLCLGAAWGHGIAGRVAQAAVWLRLYSLPRDAWQPRRGLRSSPHYRRPPNTSRRHQSKPQGATR